jgi:hypothetical protein
LIAVDISWTFNLFRIFRRYFSRLSSLRWRNIAISRSVHPSGIKFSIPHSRWDKNWRLALDFCNSLTVSQDKTLTIRNTKIFFICSYADTSTSTDLDDAFNYAST